MKTPISDALSWDASDWDALGPMRMVVGLEAAQDLEIRLGKALEALKQVAETARSGHGECLEWLDATIKELETV